jgi:hypothetical protein
MPDWRRSRQGPAALRNPIRLMSPMGQKHELPRRSIVDEVKFQLQRSGYAAAFSDSRVMEAIRSGPNGRIAVELVEWSGPLSQKIVIDWMVISDNKTARLFGDHIVEAPRAFADSTSISAGIDFAMTQLDRAPYQTSRRAIDVSGDGDNNSAVMLLRHGTRPSLKASQSAGSSS